MWASNFLGLGVLRAAGVLVWWGAPGQGIRSGQLVGLAIWAQQLSKAVGLYGTRADSLKSCAVQEELGRAQVNNSVLLKNCCKAMIPHIGLAGHVQRAAHGCMWYSTTCNVAALCHHSSNSSPSNTWPCPTPVFTRLGWLTAKKHGL